MKNLIIILIIASAISCSKDDPVVTLPIIDYSLDFGELKVGNEMSFLRFESTCEDFQGDFKLTGDTLKWTVSSMDGDAAVLSEKFTEGSPLSPDFPQVDLSITPDQEYILIPDRWSSNLFFFYGNDTLWVDPSATVNLSQDQCHLMVDEDDFRGDAIAFINEFKIQDYQFDNMTVVSCVPGSVRDAYIIYADGKIKAIYSEDWFSGVPSGWIAL